MTSRLIASFHGCETPGEKPEELEKLIRALRAEDAEEARARTEALERRAYPNNLYRMTD